MEKIILILAACLLLACSQKVNTPRGSVDDRLREVRYYDGCNWVIEYPSGARGMTSLGCSNIDSLNIKNSHDTRIKNMA